MNKSELVEDMATKSGLTKAASEKALNAFTESVKQALIRGEKVQLVGFGTFETKHREERQGRNPQTKAEITIPAQDVPSFKAGSTLKEAVKGE